MRHQQINIEARKKCQCYPMSMRIEQNMANNFTYKNSTNEWELIRDIKSLLHLYLNKIPPPPPPPPLPKTVWRKDLQWLQLLTTLNCFQPSFKREFQSFMFTKTSQDILQVWILDKGFFRCLRPLTIIHWTICECEKTNRLQLHVYILFTASSIKQVKIKLFTNVF